MINYIHVLHMRSMYKINRRGGRVQKSFPRNLPLIFQLNHYKEWFTLNILIYLSCAPRMVFLNLLLDQDPACLKDRRWTKHLPIPSLHIIQPFSIETIFTWKYIKIKDLATKWQHSAYMDGSGMQNRILLKFKLFFNFLLKK